MKWIMGIVALALILTGTAIYAANALLRPEVAADIRPFGTKVSGTTGQGDVEIALTPRIEGGTLVVAFGMNTHSVDLSEYDLTEVMVLHAGGEQYRPLSAPALGGHHVTGEVEFSVEPEGGFRIVVSGIPLEDRAYEW